MRQVSWALSHGRRLIPRSPPCAAFLPRIDDADHPLGTGIDMHMSDFDGLLVTATVLVQCLDEVELQAQQPGAIAPVHADVCLLQVTLAALQKLETGKSRGNDLNSKQGL